MVETGVTTLAESSQQKTLKSVMTDVWITAYKFRQLQVIQEREHWTV